MLPMVVFCGICFGAECEIPDAGSITFPDGDWQFYEPDNSDFRSENGVMIIAASSRGCFIRIDALTGESVVETEQLTKEDLYSVVKNMFPNEKGSGEILDFRHFMIGSHKTLSFLTRGFLAGFSDVPVKVTLVDVQGEQLSFLQLCVVKKHENLCMRETDAIIATFKERSRDFSGIG